MATVLVTGGAGYIGSHACKRLAAAGHTPVVYDNLACGHSSAVRWGPLVVGDLLDWTCLEEAFVRFRPESVLHFASLIDVAESAREPMLYYRNNVGGTMTLLEVMRKRGVERLVFSSTCAIYGAPLATPIDENHPQEPINAYGATKHTIERMLRHAGSAHGLRSIALRYFNAAGADPDGDLGEMHDPETHAVPLAIQAALGQRPTFHLFGTDYPTPDGTAVRDYVHVCDLADAHLSALSYLERGGDTTACNLGTGVGISVRQVIAAVERCAGRRMPVAHNPRRQGDAPILVARADRAGTLLGWQPRLSAFAEIVDTAWRWHSLAAARSVA
jgi:UDP-glucose-4-epimerase GalE